MTVRHGGDRAWVLGAAIDVSLQQTVGEAWCLSGCDVPARRSAVAEVYPSLWSGSFVKENRNEHRHDAFSVAEWMRRSGLDGTLEGFFAPALAPAEPKRRILKAGYWNFNEPARSRQTFAELTAAPVKEERQILPPLSGGTGLSSFRGRATREPPGQRVCCRGPAITETRLSNTGAYTPGTMFPN